MTIKMLVLLLCTQEDGGDERKSEQSAVHCLVVFDVLLVCKKIFRTQETLNLSADVHSSTITMIFSGLSNTAYRLKQTYNEAPLVALFGSVW